MNTIENFNVDIEIKYLKINIKDHNDIIRHYLKVGRHRKLKDFEIEYVKCINKEIKCLNKNLKRYYWIKQTNKLIY